MPLLHERQGRHGPVGTVKRLRAPLHREGTGSQGESLMLTKRRMVMAHSLCMMLQARDTGGARGEEGQDPAIVEGDGE